MWFEVMGEKFYCDIAHMVATATQGFNKFPLSAIGKRGSGATLQQGDRACAVQQPVQRNPQELGNTHQMAGGNGIVFQPERNGGTSDMQAFGKIILAEFLFLKGNKQAFF